MIIISIIGIKEWKPLSRTHKLDRLIEDLSPEQLNLLHADFAKWSCEFIKYRAKECVRRQIFPVKYAPLNGDYVRWKDKNGLKPGFWQATGTLANTMQVWETTGQENHWNIGWPPSVKHDNGFPIQSIAQRLERGDKATNLPGRPLFTPLAEAYSKRIMRYFADFAARHYPSVLPYLGDGDEAENATIVSKVSLKRR